MYSGGALQVFHPICGMEEYAMIDFRTIRAADPETADAMQLELDPAAPAH